MSASILKLPSGGLFSGIERVVVHDITLRNYLELLSKRNNDIAIIESLIMGFVIRDEAIVSKLPNVDKEFILTNVFADNFRDTYSFIFTCPVCENKVTESFFIPDYKVFYLDDDDGKMFTYHINNRQIFLHLPHTHNTNIVLEDYLHVKSQNEQFNEDEKQELLSYIISEINLNIGIQKNTFMYCPFCGVELPVERPCGSILFKMTPEIIEIERKNILELFNYFSYAAHQPIAGLMDLTYKDVLFMWKHFVDIKEKEAKEFNKARKA
jgi:hypothetical protein